MSQFGQSILKKTATRSHILKLQCTQFDFGWTFTPDPAEGAYRPPSWILKVLLIREGKWRGRGQKENRRGEKGGKERGENESGRRREGKRKRAPVHISGHTLSLRHGA